ncbi:malonyl-CoA decarboxylase domain-containing protein [Arthrobacter sp. KK5.5]|uniref:malonyl-CoA decarboxylase domain-containing protein n=1 Tax=Arthrobacter sp. KK5.5 TaxID=3373084 RepID=UPI003EE6C7EF
MDTPVPLSARLTANCAALLDVGDGHFKPAMAAAILDEFEELDAHGRAAFFRFLHRDLTPDPEAVGDAIAHWQTEPSQEAAQRLHAVSESPRQALLRGLNLAPDGTFRLVSMRSRFLEVLDRHPEFKPVDQDFLHLFRSWFNAGFLKLQELSWDSSSALVEHILDYESVHPLGSWSELRSRLKPADRKCFAFLHPSMGDRPLIFVEVAVTEEIPHSTEFMDDLDRVNHTATGTVATLYSINNTFPGLRGIPFGNHLIKQVIAHVRRENPRITTFVTLSPVPGFRAWLQERSADGSDSDGLIRAAEKALQPGAPDDAVSSVRAAITAAAHSYLLESTDSRGRPLDRVARFHLRNGATLHRINWPANTGRHVMEQSMGLMANYIYQGNELHQLAAAGSYAAATHSSTTAEEAP